MHSANIAKTSGERAIERLAASGTACPKSRTSVYVGFCSSRTFLAIHLNIALTWRVDGCVGVILRQIVAPETKTNSERTYKRYVQLKNGIGAARRRPHRTPSLTKSTSDCAVLLRSRRTKRGGIMSEWHLSMRVLSVVPRYAVTVGSLKGGTVIGKTPEERGKLH